MKNKFTNRYELDGEDCYVYRNDCGDYVLYDDVKDLIEIVGEILEDQDIELQGTEHDYKIGLIKALSKVRGEEV